MGPHLERGLAPFLLLAAAAAAVRRLPFRNFLLWIPTSSFILMVVAFSWIVGGRRPAIYAAIFGVTIILLGLKLRKSGGGADHTASAETA